MRSTTDYWTGLSQLCHVPYSGTPQTAVVQGERGWYPGVRVEVISYPITITAFQGAFALCLAHGDRPVALFTDPPSDGQAEQPSDSTFWTSWPGIQNSYGSDLPPEALEALSDPKRLHLPVEIPSDLQSGLGIRRVERVLDDARRDLIARVIPFAHTPNSDFPVAAVLETDQGLLAGVNVEFPAWNLGLCAERYVLHLAAVLGARPGEAMMITAPKGDFCSPCGLCRQTMVEWPGLRRLLLYHGDGTSSEHGMDSILPFSFHAKDLSGE